jgi:ATP-binding cassette subfamily C protein LapB
MESVYSGDFEGGDNSLLECLLFIARFHDRELSRETAIVGLPVDNGVLTPSNFSRAAKRASFASSLKKRELSQINPSLLPAILILDDNQACVLVSIGEQENTVEAVFPELSNSIVTMPKDELVEQYTERVIYCRPEMVFDDRSSPVIKGIKKHWFWDVFFENKGLYRDVLIASFMINLFSAALPLFIMNVYDRVVPNHALDTLWVLSIGVMVVVMFDLFLKLMRNWFIDLAANRTDVKLSAAIMEKVLQMKMVDKPKSTGAFANQLQSFESLRNIISSFSIVAIVDLPFTLIFIVIIAMINPWLILPVLVGVGAVLFYAVTAQKKMQRLSEDSMQASAERNSILYESISNLEIVKSLCSESKIQAEWERTTIYITRIAAKMKFIAASIASATQWVQHTAGVVMIIIGVYLISDNELSQGGLVAAYLLTSRVMGPISSLAGIIGQYHQAATSLRVLDDVMDKPKERPDNKSWIGHSVFKGEIEFKNVYFKFPGSSQYILNNVSFKIKANEKVVILGANGSGKTTILKLILGLYEPESGQVLIDGIDIYQIDPYVLRTKIGYVPQDLVLFYGSLKDNIAMSSLDVEDEKILEVAGISGLNQFIRNNPEGFNMPVGERGGLLSQGQRQSVVIARSLINSPPMLLLDEPTSNLDNTIEAKVIRSLDSYIGNKTVIMVTHRQSLLTMAERVIVVDGGEIVADGAKEKILEDLRSGKVVGSKYS